MRIALPAGPGATSAPVARATTTGGERTRAALMLALYRDGRQAEALEESRRARVQLADELGVDPGSRLTELETAILAQDPILIPVEPTPDVQPPATETSPAGPSRRIVTICSAAN